jgi:small-conductance mechanosensitive channel/CRP-like cAMP-binding protein
MTPSGPPILAQSVLVDGLAILAFAYLALLGVAAVRDRSSPRLAWGISLLVTAAAGVVAWLGIDAEIPITVSRPADETTYVVDIPVLRTLAEVAAASAIGALLGRLADTALVAAGREPMLRVQHTAFWLGAILAGVVVIYQVHFAATLPVKTLVLSVGGASVFIVGLALQSTLSNVFAGYALQTSRILRKGDIVQLGHRGPVGTVWDSTLGTTRILMRDGELLVLPNSAVLQKDFLNLDQPHRRLRQSIQVGVSYDAPPAVVKDVALSVLRAEPLVLREPEPEVWVANFAESSVTYDLRFWIASYRDRDAANDRVRTRLWYALRDAGLEIPVPIRTLRMTDASELRARDEAAAERTAAVIDALRACPLFDDGSISAEERRELARAALETRWDAGIAIVRRGDRSDAMYVIASGSCEVRLPDGGTVTLEAGGHFGEIALLLRQERTADVVAGPAGATVLRLPRPSVAPVLARRPEFRERVGTVATQRRDETMGDVAPKTDPARRSILAELLHLLRPF